jgi:hypothetical protein
MSGHVHWGDPKPTVRDVSKPLLVARATTLVAVPFWSGLVLLVILFFGLPSVFGIHDLEWFAWCVSIWLVILAACFLVRGFAVASYKKRPAAQAAGLRKAEGARRPQGLTNDYAAGIAMAGDDALIRNHEITPKAAKLQTAVDDLNAKEQSKIPRRQHLQDARGFETKANKATGEQAAQLWVDAANSYRLAGEPIKARYANKRAYDLNPHKSKPKT